MRITMRQTITGTRNGEPWPERGGSIDLPDDEASELVAAGIAEPAVDEETAGDEVEADPNLDRLNKAQLLEFAASINATVDPELTKAQIVAVIAEHRSASQPV